MTLIGMFLVGVYGVVCHIWGFQRGAKFGGKWIMFAMRKSIVRHLVDDCPCCGHVIDFDTKYALKERTLKEYGPNSEKHL